MREWFRKLLGPYGPETKKVQLGFFFGSWAVLAAIGLFIPETVLTDNPSVRAFTDFMASFIPQIDRVTVLNLKPEVNRLHYSILWAVSPVFPGLLLPAIWRTAPPVGTKRPTFSQILGAILFCAWMIGFTMFLWWGLGLIDNPANMTARAMFNHGLSRAIWAPVMVNGFWMFLSLLIFVLWSLMTGRYYRAERSESHG